VPEATTPMCQRTMSASGKPAPRTMFFARSNYWNFVVMNLS
jgi:hypothetical protein